MTHFSDLKLNPHLLAVLNQEGYETPTPIQAQAIPHLLNGYDLLGIAQTGTGKTAAFALPILHKLAEHKTRVERGTCRVLILSPTRELCAQIHESFKTYGRDLRISSTVVFGGVGLGRQVETLRNGVDVLVATPGRLCDLIERRAVTISKLETFVLDEVDQMLDLGFIHAIRKITSMLPKQRQNLFFSATMPKEIAGLANALLRDPVRVEVAPVATTAERVAQSVIHVDPGKKIALLIDLLKDNNMTRTLVFTRTKHGADKVVKALVQAGYNTSAIHGNKSQANREKALAGFKSGKVLALVATDIAARGIDIDGVSHVINFDLPHVPESYVHRIGRTARAGADGEAIAFCIPEDRGLLRDIERTIRQAVPVKEHEMGLKVEELAPNHGWNPAGKGRSAGKSGGGRHMPNSAKKPHRGQPGFKKPEGAFLNPASAPKGDWTPVGMPMQAIDQSQFANRGRAAEGDAQAPEQRRSVEAAKTDRPREERSHSDRPRFSKPFGDKPRGDRPQGDRPQGDRPQGDRPHGDRPRFSKPYSDRPRGDRPHGDRPRGDRPQGDRPQGDRPFASKQWSNKPRGDKPFGDKPRDSKPYADKPWHSRGGSDRPQGDRPQGDRPMADRPMGDRPMGDRPFNKGPRKEFGKGPRPPFKGKRDGGFGKPKRPGGAGGKPSWMKKVSGVDA